MIIDIVVLVVVFVSALISFLRGFIREILTIFGTVGAFFVAYFCGPFLAPWIAELLGKAPGDGAEAKLFGPVTYDLAGSALAYGSIFIVVVILLSLLSHMIAEAAKSVGLGALDRTVGVVFGLVRGVLLLGLLNLPVYIFAKDAESRPDFLNDAIERSSSYFYIEQTSSMIEGFIPDNADELVVETANEGIEAVKEPLTEKVIESVIAPKIEGDSAKTPEGYSEEFRDKMDKLFEEGAAEAP